MFDWSKKIIEGQFVIALALVGSIFAQAAIVVRGVLTWRRFGYPVPRDPGGIPSFEMRVVMFVLTGSFLSDLMEPVGYILGVPTAMLTRIVSMTHAPGLVISLLVLSGLATIPLLLCLTVAPRFLSCRTPRKMACASGCTAAVLWAYFGTLAQPLDDPALPFIYWRASIGALVVAATFAVSLNNQQLRALGHP